MDLVAVGKRVKQKRNQLGMNQKELAEKLGWAGGTVSRLESGKGGEPAYDAVRALGKVLETSPAWLIDGDSLDFRGALSRLESDPAIKDALLKIAGWYEVADPHDRNVLRDGMLKLGRLFSRYDVKIKAWSESDLADFGGSNGKAPIPE